MKNIAILLLLVYCGCIAAGEQGTAQDFVLPTVNGGTVSLSEVNSKTPVVLVFWATWCPMCVQEIPSLNKMSESYKGKIEILAVNAGENVKKVSDFMKKKNIKYPVLLDTKNEVTKKYNIVGIPTNIFLDKGGKILYNGHDLKECEKLIK